MPRHFDKRMTRLATEPLLPRHEGQPWCVCVCVCCCWVFVVGCWSWSLCVVVCWCVSLCVVAYGCVLSCVVVCCCALLCVVVCCCMSCTVCCVLCVSHLSFIRPAVAPVEASLLSLATDCQAAPRRPHAAGTNTGKPSAAAVQRPLHSRMPPVRTHVTVVLARFLGWRPHLPTAESGGSADDGPR